MIYILLVITDHFMVKKNNTYFLYISAISDILVHEFGQLYLTQKGCTIVSFMSYFIYYLYTEKSHVAAHWYMYQHKLALK